MGDGNILWILRPAKNAGLRMTDFSCTETSYRFTRNSFQLAALSSKE